MNFKARIEYDGTDYFGWQIQPKVNTVQGEIEDVLKDITGSNIRIRYASRTDRGVHARGQIISFKMEKDINASQIAHALNTKTSRDITIKELKVCSPDFNPRYNVKYKLYRYRILNRKLNDYILKDFVWHIKYELDLGIIKKGLKIIEGRHNFEYFSSCKDSQKDRNLNIIKTGFSRQSGDLLILSFKAEYFLTYMIRYLVGYLVAAASKKASLEELEDMLRGKGKLSNYCAPALGLELTEVRY